MQRPIVSLGWFFKFIFHFKENPVQLLLTGNSTIMAGQQYNLSINKYLNLNYIPIHFNINKMIFQSSFATVPYNSKA